MKPEMCFASLPCGRPLRGPGAETQDEGGACFGVGFLREDDEDGRRIFDRAPEAKPGMERDVAHGLGRNIA